MTADAYIREGAPPFTPAQEARIRQLAREERLTVRGKDVTDDFLANLHGEREMPAVRHG